MRTLKLTTGLVVLAFVASGCATQVVAPNATMGSQAAPTPTHLNSPAKPVVPTAVESYQPPVLAHGLTIAPAKAPSLHRVCTLQDNTSVSYGLDPFYVSAKNWVNAILVCPQEPDVWRHSRLWVQVPQENAQALLHTITTTHSKHDFSCRAMSGPVMPRSQQVMIDTPFGGWYTVRLPTGPGCSWNNPVVDRAIATAIEGVPAIRPLPRFGDTSITEYAQPLDAAGLVGTPVTEPNAYDPCTNSTRTTGRQDVAAIQASAVLICPFEQAPGQLQRRWIEVTPADAKVFIATLLHTPSQYSPKPQVCYGLQVQAPQVLALSSPGGWIKVPLPNGACSRYPSDAALKAIAIAIANRPAIRPEAFPPTPHSPYDRTTSHVITASGLTFVVPKTWRDFPQYAWSGSLGGYFDFLANQRIDNPCAVTNHGPLTLRRKSGKVMPGDTQPLMVRECSLPATHL